MLTFDPVNDVPQKRTVNATERDLYNVVLKYLARNPDAMDTLEGIAEWWVMRQRIDTSVSALARVLRRLIEDGLVEEVGSAEEPRYRLRKEPESAEPGIDTTSEDEP